MLESARLEVHKVTRPYFQCSRVSKPNVIARATGWVFDSNSSPSFNSKKVLLMSHLTLSRKLKWEIPPNIPPVVNSFIFFNIYESLTWQVCNSLSLGGEEIQNEKNVGQAHKPLRRQIKLEYTVVQALMSRTNYCKNPKEEFGGTI